MDDPPCSSRSLRPARGPSGSQKPTAGPSGSQKATAGPSGSQKPTPGSSGSQKPTPGPSGSLRSTRGSSGSQTPASGSNAPSVALRRSTGSSVAVRRSVKRHLPRKRDFGTYICEQYSVLKLVLSYLNYFDLNMLREVNVSLKAGIDILLKKRSWIESTILSYQNGPDWRLKSVLGGHFVDLRIEPKVLFSFEVMPGSPISRLRPKICMRLHDRDDKRFFPRNEIVPDCVKTFLPIGAKGIIYMEKNRKNEMDFVLTMKPRSLVLLYMPTSDSYDVSIFTDTISSDEFAEEPIRAFFTSDPRPIRGLIFLRVGASNIDAMVRFIVRMVSNNQSETFALCGGHISSLDEEIPPKKNIPGIIKVIIFRGDGIRCVSDCITSTMSDGVVEGLRQTSWYVNENLGKLDIHRSFILMFQCVDRYILPIVDHIYISKAFPNIPLYGLLTLGEIGFRSFTMPESRHEPKRSKSDIIHVVTTTFMIISIDK